MLVMRGFVCRSEQGLTMVPRSLQIVLRILDVGHASPKSVVRQR